MTPYFIRRFFVSPTERVAYELCHMYNKDPEAAVLPCVGEDKVHTPFSYVVDDVMDLHADSSPLVIISKNMTKIQLTDALLKHILMRHDLDVSGDYKQRHPDIIAKCMAKLERIPLYIDDTNYASVDELIAALKRFVTEKECMRFYIDCFHMDEPEKLLKQARALERFGKKHHVSFIQFMVATIVV